MSYPEHSRFEFHRNGNAYRRDKDAQPRVLLLGSVADCNGGFAGVIVHIAGDPYTREIPRRAIDAEMIDDLEPAQAFALGRFVEGGELELDQSENLGYVEPVPAKSGAGIDSPNSKRRKSAPPRAGAFLLPAFNGGVYGRLSSLPGLSFWTGLSTRVRRHLHRLTAAGGGSNSKGATQMKYLLTLPRRRAKARAHRRMAMAALRADSSLSVRQARFDHHMTIARNIERGQS